MGISIAVLIGSAMIAAAILIALRWEVALGPAQPPVVRLDRWTGTVTVCNLDATAADRAIMNHTAVNMDCIAP
jgi:hypothetical protein